MKRKTLEKKSTFGAMMVMLMLTAASLTGCASGQTVEKAATEENAKEAAEEADDAEEAIAGTEDAEAEDKTAIGEEETTAVGTAAETATGTEEATEDAESEEASEGVVYEGIDMESTLPGVEWIETFYGIIDEPKLVVFNDETNKKVILENGQKVDFSTTDILAVYTAKGKIAYVDSLEDNHAYFFSNNERAGHVRIYYQPTPGFNDGDMVDITSRMETLDGEEVVLTATLVVRKNK